MQESESSFLLGDEIVGNSVTETDIAMELCKKVQVEEYVIHVVGSTNFYTRLQFSLLASTWFPRPLGVCLWSALHVLLVLYEALILLIFFSTGFVLAVSYDAVMVATLVYIVLIIPLVVIGIFLGIIIVTVFAWLWLLITCKCCTMPGRAPGQSLGQYIFSAGGTLGQQNPQPAPVVEGGAAPAEEPGGLLNRECRASYTLKFVNHVIQVTYPYRRAQLGDLCREIVPWYNTTVI